MLLDLLAVLNVTLGAGASSCDPSVEGLHIDRQSLDGTWWIQVQYGIPPVTNNRCYNTKLSVNCDNRLDNLQSWKVGSESFNQTTPEIGSPVNCHADSGKGKFYFQLPDGIEEVWFVQVDRNEYYAMYGCKNGKEPVFLIATKRQERNQTLIDEITDSVAKNVVIPKGVHWIDNLNC